MQTKSSNPQSGSNGFGLQPTPSTIASTTDGAGAAVSREFHNLAADVEDVLKSTTKATGEELTRLKATLNEYVASARQSVEELGDAIANQARKSGTATNEYVHQQPWKAIGIGAAAGFLLGILFARRG